jgi:hypothetical protein
MNPIEFKNKWKLTYAELAVALGYTSDRTVRSWELTGTLRREPQPPVWVVCHLLDEKWLQQGKSVIAGLNTIQHPIGLKNKWRLSYVELAIVLGYTNDRTVRSWGTTRAQCQRYPQAPACVAAYLLNEKWLQQGKNIVSYLFLDESA